MARCSFKRLFKSSRSKWRLMLMAIAFSVIALVYIVRQTHNAARGVYSVQSGSAKKKLASLCRDDGCNIQPEAHFHKPSNMVTHVRFLKVHKAGSTTIQNMMFRFALRHDLNVLLPTYGHYMNADDAQVPMPASDHFDLFACHTSYSKQWFDSILPNDSVNIGIVRHPTDRFISAAFYYRDYFKEPHLMAVPQDNFIHHLVQHPEKYEKYAFSRTRNAMGKDFGFLQALSSTDTKKIKSHLDFLGNEFPLVMVMERFDESLILLRRLLKWSLQDIVYLRINIHRYQRVKLEKWEISKLNKTNFIDVAVYEFFSKRFDMKVKLAGPDFHDEVVHFNRTLENVSMFCKAHLGDSFQVEASKWNEHFTIDVEDCDLMKKGEISFITELRTRHNKKYSDRLNQTKS